MYATGYDNSNGMLIYTRYRNSKEICYTSSEADKDIIAMALTFNHDSTIRQTGVIVDQDGKVYTVGYNGNGEMGNETLESLTVPVMYK